ncbi:M14 family metallopeptidase [Flectobacillus sp. BAB-3569]|uniref:M14 family metallopeptidase n=1 Tax=Flectobacillus sp. BAB-3569 TaxID=1509483 RepID=UPI000BA4073F|nr:M14 family metallopeptidase [Flectobacillus sp. BAB-3569]PAC31246.1 peptidase M14 [Flectobacillus sp. BAB-3569]
MKKIFILAGLLAFSGCAFAQSSYPNHAQLSARLKTLSSKYATTTKLESIGKSKGGKDLFAITLSKGDASAKPAIAILAGADGAHLAGTEVALQLAEKLVASDSLAKILETKTFYIIPSINPDAQEQFSAKLKFERSGNDVDTDDDRDGRLNEDPFEDLNNDGQITWMRIEDPSGTFIISKEDPRVMVKADPSKGEVGKYILLSEGIDNDKDGVFNEDGVGGVNIDKNGTYDYPFFTQGSGEYAASESETKALLDFLYTTKNIYAVFTFGPANNLSEATKFDKSKTLKRIITGILEKDASVGEQISKLYNAQTGLKDAPAMPQTKGNLSQTAYYHYGRLSFSTPTWWAPKVSATKDSTKKEIKEVKASDNEDIRFLKWADAQQLKGSFVAWQKINHPDFPNQTVEVGGIAPYAKLNPPLSYLNETTDKHLKFFKAFTAQMSDLQILNVKTEAVSAGLTRVTVQVTNKGLLPTGSEIGDRVRWVQKVRTEVKTSSAQTIISGKKVNLRGAMSAGESQEYSWLISGSGSITIEAGNAMTGIKTVSVALK